MNWHTHNLSACAESKKEIWLQKGDISLHYEERQQKMQLYRVFFALETRQSIYFSLSPARYFPGPIPAHLLNA